MKVLTDEERRKGLGGTDVAAIVGLSPYTTPIEVWQEKTGRAAPFEQTPRMRLGQIVEQAIADAYSERTERRLRRIGVVFHKEHPFLYVHPDRRVVGERGLVECKATSSPIRFAEGPPPDIKAQCQWQLALTDTAWVDVVVLNGTQLDIFRIEADAEVQEWLVAEALRFWHEHVVADTPPPVDGSDAYRRWVEQRWPDATEEERGATAEEDVLIEGIVTAREAIAKLVNHKATLENKLAESMSSYGKLTTVGATVTYRVQAASEYLVQREAKRVLRVNKKKERKH